MIKYTSLESCAKCGSNPVDDNSGQNNISKGFIAAEGDEPEKLQLQCRVCGFIWYVLPLDAPAP